ncbi:Cys-tRNA(Pro) deacylase [Clostridium sp. CCUG 7971]|uniref:Cys-tRNA(Pro) deacylase n=1 Tax=Clostridium sp. CCUG 7971 TaxID=2811414 RepID=UPI001ABBDB21|nr:Cys-tRNA(Pro) deacylase [Clostridium sp. CCUG 7971]MBO3444486.1 Cys-tRNA(Pro) deacylase [Clostridium sp. CCUG 7971]
MSKVKTNAMRILDSNKVSYNMFSYNVKKGEHVDGVEVAKQIGKDEKEVYKTLVAQGNSKTIYIYVIPVNESLDLKKAANVAKEKKIEMIHVADINNITGYIRGGCSPIGMKKKYKTFVNETASNLEQIIVSAGKIGYQVQLNPLDLQKITECEFIDIIK